MTASTRRGAALAAALALLLAVPATCCRGSACCVGEGAALGAGADLTERLLVVDSDGGADDAMALLALLGAEAEQPSNMDGTRVRVLAVTCVRGNTGLQNVTRNVQATLRSAGRSDVPVFRGAAESLLVSPPTDHYFGGDGFGDFLAANASYGAVRAEHAAVALVRLAARYPGRISLVCLGPVTNVALASRLDPKFLHNLKDVFILGGSSTGVGNTKAATEFNVYIDAEAFEAVLSSVPRPAYMMPWEAVTSTGVTQEWRARRLGTLGTPQVEFLNKAERVALQKAGGVGGYNPADAMLALFVLRPDLVPAKTTTTVQVVLGDGFARAATLVDYVGRSGRPKNAVVLQRADRALAECLLVELLSAPVQADKAV